MIRCLTMSLPLVALLACAAPEPALTAAVDKRSIDGTTERALLEVRATDAKGDPGQGAVSLVTGAGAFLEGGEVPLVDGAAHATFRCNPNDDAACNGDIRLGVSWAGQAANLVVRVGAAVQPDVYWRVIPTGVAANLLAVAAAPDGSTWAVGTGGTALRFAAGRWTSVATGVTVDLRAVWAGPGSVVVAGQGGVVLRWDGTAFAALAADPREDFTSAWGADDAHVYLTTASGALYGCDGAALTLLQTVGAPLHAVAGLGGELWAVGDGVVVHDAGSGWSAVATPVAGRWTALLLGGDGVWLAGERTDALGGPRGLVLAGPTPDWRASQLSTEPVVALAWPAASAERFAVTATEVYRKVGDEAWVATRAPIGGNAIAGHSGAEVIVVGDLGTAIQRVP